jgi:hypothetical protein
LLIAEEELLTDYSLVSTSCRYLAETRWASPLKNCVCLCDDDNDLEMALGCSHAYIPSISSKSLAETIEADSSFHFTQTCGDGVKETAATEAALALILDRVK